MPVVLIHLMLAALPLATHKTADRFVMPELRLQCGASIHRSTSLPQQNFSLVAGWG
jgi:hypothetical protein